MDPFIGEIRMFCGNFAPVGWQLCNGQLLPISQYQALFSILGTNFGGNGTTNFGLPNLQGRVPMHWGTGQGLTPRTLGESGGVENVVLTQQQMPLHTHAAAYSPTAGTPLAVSVAAAAAAASNPNPVGNILAESQTPGRPPVSVNSYAAPTAATGALAGVTVSGTGQITVTPAGGSLPVPVVQPFQVVSFIIALVGIFPSRN